MSVAVLAFGYEERKSIQTNNDNVNTYKRRAAKILVGIRHSRAAIMLKFIVAKLLHSFLEYIVGRDNRETKVQSGQLLKLFIR